MFRRMLMALTMMGVLSAAGLGIASTAEAHCGGYGGGYGAYYGGYGPGYTAYYGGYGPSYAAYYGGYPAGYYAAPVVVYPRHYHHRQHDGVVVSFGF